mgnify:CR=1 FL=1
MGGALQANRLSPLAMGAGMALSFALIGLLFGKSVTWNGQARDAHAPALGSQRPADSGSVLERAAVPAAAPASAAVPPAAPASGAAQIPGR